MGLVFYWSCSRPDLILDPYHGLTCSMVEIRPWEELTLIAEGRFYGLILEALVREGSYKVPLHKAGAGWQLCLGSTCVKGISVFYWLCSRIDQKPNYGDAKN